MLASRSMIAAQFLLVLCCQAVLAQKNLLDLIPGT
jgi:hypothetical protein